MNDKYILWGAIGLLVIGVVALFVNSTSSSSGPSASDNSAVQGIVTANANALASQTSVQLAQLSTLNSLGQTIVNANTAVKINANNNATALSTTNMNDTLALDVNNLDEQEAQLNSFLNSNTSIADTSAATNASIVNTSAQAGAQETSSIFGFLGNLASSAASFFKGGSIGTALPSMPSSVGPTSGQSISQYYGVSAPAAGTGVYGT